MRTLIVGAGATGGYYGARLAEAGADVTFLVRPARAAKLAADGLNVRSPLGDLHLPDPPTVTADRLVEAGRFDLILLSCKAYDLDSAISDLAPAVGADTAILPVLNGMSHLDALDARFGAERVLGGSCAIAATVAPDGAIRHMSELCSITYGERDGSRSARIEAVDAMMRGLKFQPRLSDVILQEMWEKWVFLATLAGATTLMRAAVGDIVAAPEGTALIEALHAECTIVAASSGFEPRAIVAERARAQLTAAGSTFTASMLRDIESKGRIEADHVIGDLIARGQRLAPEVSFPVLTAVYTGLKAYEARRVRETA
ncbi:MULTISPECIES: 2-dehydropantoate 2-reductase [Methylobacterium]|jgi:2-dehydropantoate 2-reductase|uniref:2-dehydropantoate 2-reductase n=1 Tax=Methylobacterium oryzae CBMB20 TaxID=693986 RepID=A0A089NIZ3_9HYPH|nr:MULTISPECIES: 2-dehydropantoate 2-reductase [Methylobacterium]AIQ87841.1 2-dehydropantoate 2-reductase [Methylobacterium oryzae CBMB20]AWV14390.1 2-dehydropantoate 2-reductase [Methylobacterium sp. XJLW]WFS07869.1 2-dehydropantoate 2-reductase [Methylobacterium sp. 391_Methyba4]